ncbi:cuticle protein 8-like [Penaeus chinensis]|uniref:cuticle protein 8-like n=1 Tax=Penaeus chinensis TaxID=139456 RepID=UPI001FB826EA|nr:cuticle protein 8-like [Penaeus chinensis]
MSLKVILVACVAAVALADKAPVHHLPPVYTAPTYHAPEPVYHAPAHYKEPEYPTVPPKYNYNYGVADGYSGANFAASESREGYKTEGSYTIPHHIMVSSSQELQYICSEKSIHVCDSRAFLKENSNLYFHIPGIAEDGDHYIKD